VSVAEFDKGDSGLNRAAEWWTDRIQPWLHYIPIKVDYSDVYDTLAYVSALRCTLSLPTVQRGHEW